MNKLLLALVVLLTACATPTTKVNVAGIERSNLLKVMDLRPELEKKDEIFSISIMSDAYAIYRVSDAALDPAAIRILQHRAYETLGVTGPLEIKVNHFVIYRNLQAEFRHRSYLTSVGGAIGTALAGRPVFTANAVANSLVNSKTFDSLAETEYKRGFYSPQENPGRGSAYIVYLETEIMGQRVFTRTFSPIKEKEQETAVLSAAEAAIKFHLATYQKE